jgi:hypothetical protein
VDLMSEPTYDAKDTAKIEFNDEPILHVLQVAQVYFNERERKELEHCLYYAENLHHGADGHNRMMLVAKLASALGISLAGEGIAMPHLFVGKTWWMP